MGTLALIEVLDRDGSVRCSLKVDRWPLRVGRAIDNDLVLDDPHTAAYHFRVDANEDGVAVTVGDSVNGLLIGAQRLAAGERWQAPASPLELMAGRTALRLRLSEHALAPEQPLATTRVLTRGTGSTAVLGALALAAVGLSTYLEKDPEVLLPSLAGSFTEALALSLGWCGLWTLLSKVFSRRGHFAWHVRVLVTAVLASMCVDLLAGLLAFSFSWPWLTDFDFVLQFAIGAAALYGHLQGVEPHRPRLTRSMALSAGVVGVGLTLWFNWQSSERLGSELYMHHLFPPAVRLAEPVDTDTFVQQMQPLKARLDENALKAAHDGD